MATVKVKFRASLHPDRAGVLFFQVIHNRVPRQIHTCYRIFKDEWDAVNSEIVYSNGRPLRHSYLDKVKKSLEMDSSKLKRVISRLEKSEDKYTTVQIVELFKASQDDCFLGFSQRLVDQLMQVGKRHTADTYTTVMNSFKRFLEGRELLIDEVDSVLMIEYEGWLRGLGVCNNTISFYMRNLRAIYNRAVDEKLTEQHFPFKHVYTGIDKTVKRAVPIKVIRQIKELDLSASPGLDYARNLFLFSFYTRGMSFIDMAYLKKKDLQNGVLSYCRQKTNQRLFIKWEKPMQEIIDRYDTGNSPYLLPIIREVNRDKRKQYKNAAHLVNGKLKKIGTQLGLEISLTMYVARHSWASIAKSKNIPISTICEAMGHDSEKTTRIYLASLDMSSVDKANSMVLNLL